MCGQEYVQYSLKLPPGAEQLIRVDNHKGSEPSRRLRGTWYQPCPDVCVKYGRIWVLFWLQVNKMNENVSFKKGDYKGRFFFKQI